MTHFRNFLRTGHAPTLFAAFHVQHENAKYRKAANSVGAWPVRRKFLK